MLRHWPGVDAYRSPSTYPVVLLSGHRAILPPDIIQDVHVVEASCFVYETFPPMRIGDHVLKVLDYTAVYDDIFVNCNLVATRYTYTVQYTYTHKQHTDRHKTKNT